VRTKYDLKRLFTIPVENRIGEQLRMDAAEEWRRGSVHQQKGCDIGYALATCSREGADSVDARTVTALRGDRRFRSAKSNYSLRRRRFPAAQQVTLPSESLSLLQIGEILFKPNLFSHRRQPN
jgi:hypothetical protein